MAEIVFVVLVKKTAYSLCKDQKGCCDRFNNIVSLKWAKREYANKIGYLAGTHAKLVLLGNYIKGINKRLDLSTGFIDAKKECTHKKGKRSKVLIALAIST